MGFGSKTTLGAFQCMFHENRYYLLDSGLENNSPSTDGSTIKHERNCIPLLAIVRSANK